MTKKELLKYINNNNFDVQSAKASFFALDMVYCAYADSKRTHKIEYGPVLAYISFNSLKSFFQILPKKGMEELANKLYKDYQKNPQSLYSLRKKHKKITREVKKLVNKHHKKISTAIKKELLSYYVKYIDLMHKWWQYGIIGEDKCDIINTDLVPKFQDRYSYTPKKAQEIFNIISRPDELTYFNQERILFLNICLLIYKKNKNNLSKVNVDKLISDKEIKKEITKYLKNYNWTKTDFYSAEEITSTSLINDVLKEIKRRGIKSIKTELKKIITNNNNFLKKKNKLLKQQKLTREDKKDIKYAEEILKWFDWRKFAYMSHFCYAFLLVGQIASRYGINYHEISTYSKKEIEDLLRNNKKVSKTVLDKRDNSVFCVYEKKHKKTYFYGKEGKELYNLATHVDYDNELKGLVASTGGLEKIEGNINVVMHPSQSNFKKDDILVTSMTRVEFVPLMRRAKAVITDEGGVACHAAIISRELGIPAIIGTKNATRVFKSGDKIEIDLKKGFIKKLNN